MNSSQDQPWWKSGVIYQVYPRSWMDSNGDGIGDLPGITSKLSYLSDELGVEAIWLSPFYPSPQADFGYDVSDYCEVEPDYGTLADFDRLVDTAKGLGLKVLVDFVPNHTSDQHPWFQESRASKDSPKRDWYTWRPPAADGGPPNNWISVFEGPAWTLDPTTGEYYLHSFLPQQPDLNWRNPEVEHAMHQVLRFWQDRGVDGFRIDVAHRIAKDPELRDNPPAVSPPPAYKSEMQYHTLEHIHDQAHPDIHGMYHRLRKVVDSHPSGSSYTVGEIHDFDWKHWVTYYGNNDELNQPYNFVLLDTKLDAAKIRAAISGMEAVLPDWAWPNWVFSNHDEKRPITQFGRPGSRAAALMLLTLRGTPTIYMGDEIGMEDIDVPAAQQQDPWGRRMPGLGRDGNRSPMQWNDQPHAGFSSPEAPATWLPVHPNYRSVNVEQAKKEPDSHFGMYRRLLEYRRNNPSLVWGDIELVELGGGASNPLVYRRRHPGATTQLVVINLSDEPVDNPATGSPVGVATSLGLEVGPAPEVLSGWQGLVVPEP